MNFVQEFTQQQLSRCISSHLTEQLQNCHSACEDLISNLEALRYSPKLGIVESKLHRLQCYQTTKQQLIALLENTSDVIVTEWLLNSRPTSELLNGLLKKQEPLARQMLQNVIKRVFLKQQSIKELVEEREMVVGCVSLLKEIRDDISLNRTPGRQKVMNTDIAEKVIEERIACFDFKIAEFNAQMLTIVREIHAFQELVLQQFQQLLASK